ncbi:hypothetical protein Zmor_022938 [Zophobas morio]|uniref:Cytochrome P450 n=1 Tax=Zophobas morio TaxID=2755281 RepID=A0AA38HWZ5_9CUCU|nr:hypothetical protein Zmor_022938 [Zophobas morio]
MKFIFSLISQSGEQFVKYFLEKNEDVITVEMKDIFTRFANDVIANTAFGVQCDSLIDRENEFFLMGKEATDFRSFWKNIKFFVSYFIAPKLSELFQVRFFSKEVSDFFTSLVKTNIQSREKHGIVRPDMIHLLLEARKKGLKHDESPSIQDTGFATVEEHDFTKNAKKIEREITDQDIASQALVFFFAVDDTFEIYGGKITYEGLLGMKYMDMVVSESLRKWPNTAAVDRICTKPYTIVAKYPDERPLHLEKDIRLLIPIFAPFTVTLNIIQNQSGLIPKDSAMKTRLTLNLTHKNFVLLYFIDFRIVPVQKTPIPLVLCKKQFNLNAKDGYWLGLKRRSRI